MCLGIPGKIIDIYTAEESDLLMGRVDFGGVQKEICLAYTPEAKPEEYVIVHVGFAINRVDPQEAERTLELLRALGELEELA